MKRYINIEADEEGYIARECPECDKYFKINFGTGLLDATDCHCPYCNYIGLQYEFWTKQQIEHAQSVVCHKMTSALLETPQEMEMPPKRDQLISIGIKVKGKSIPITYYLEKELEEVILCDNCTLEYAIYDAFGFCPDCGISHSKQIVEANFNLVLKILDLSAETKGDVKESLIEKALEDSISKFDCFAREHCAGLYQTISFQNIAVAQSKVLADKGIDLSKGLDNDQWHFTVGQFQKRHLILRNRGGGDEESVIKTDGRFSSVGRKVFVTAKSVRTLVANLRVIAGNLFHGI